MVLSSSFCPPPPPRFYIVGAQTRVDIPWVSITGTSRESCGYSHCSHTSGNLSVGLGSSILLSRPEVWGFKNAQEFYSVTEFKQWQTDWRLGMRGIRKRSGRRFKVWLFTTQWETGSLSSCIPHWLRPFFSVFPLLPSPLLSLSFLATLLFPYPLASPMAQGIRMKEWPQKMSL